MDIIDRLHNCPNCGGTLQDDGACRFCGSKVYDFVSMDMDNFTPTYIRMKFHGNIVIMPVRFDHLSMNISNDRSTLYMDDAPYYTENNTILEGTIEFTVVGNTIVEDTKITGSEY